MLEQIEYGAIIPCEQYRYALWRIWDQSKPKVLFIGLNPSTADDKDDDPTITRCMSFARSWGYGGIYVVNLFAHRSPNPSELYKAIDPIGEENNKYIQEFANKSELIIAAWGNHGSFKKRSDEIRTMISNLYCLEQNKTGEPKHPLYIRSDMQPKKYIKE